MSKNVKKVIFAVIPALVILAGVIAASFFAQDYLWEKLRQKDDFYLIFTDGEKEISTVKWKEGIKAPTVKAPEGKKLEKWVYEREGDALVFDSETFTPPSKGENFIYLSPVFS